MTCCSASAVPPSGAIRHQMDHDRLLAASQTLPDGSVQTDFMVPGMHCIACIRKIERGISELAGVKNARANLSTRRVNVKWDTGEGAGNNFIAAFAGIGFEASLFDMDDLAATGSNTGRRLLLSLAVAGFAAANIMLLSVSVWSGADVETARLFQLISGLIAVPACLFAGRPFFASALTALKARQLNMDVPISLAVLLALLMSVYESLQVGRETYFDASVTLLFFLLVGRYLDHMMRERARGAVMQFSRLVPSGAVKVSDDGALLYTPVSELVAGDELMIAAGERVPVDCLIIDGISELDRSLVTGESTNVATQKGLEVEAGVLNLSGPLTCRVLRPQATSFVAEVIAMMEAAEQSGSGYVRIADRAARIYAPVVHILAALSFAGWMIATGGDWHHSIYVAIAVLIITCPCALGLAVPIAHVVAANRLFRSGIMVKDGAALEKLAEVDAAVFDKTGTLTLDELRISSIEGGSDLDHALARMMAGFSSHPAARAVALLKENRAGLLLSDMTEQAGYGLEAVWKGKAIRLGRRQWVSEISSSANVKPLPDGSEVCFARQGHELACFHLTDTLRADSVSTVDALRKQGMSLEILSGDSEATVLEVACKLGIANARGGLKPADKIARVDALQAAGHKVLYVGDGINDAPALAAAHVSIAPSSASDIGRAASDLVFTGKGLGAVTTALMIARSTKRVVLQNFALAISYNCIAIPFAVLGYVTPLIAAIAMSASSIVVVANSLRLNFMGGDKTTGSIQTPLPPADVKGEKPSPRLELVS